MSLLEKNQLRQDLRSARILEEYFAYAEENSSRCVQWRRMYFWDRIDTVLDNQLFSLTNTLGISNRPRLLRYIQNTPPSQIPPQVQSFLNHCFTYHRRSWFCESMVEKMETDIANNQVILVRDADKIAYLFKHWQGSDKVVVCLTDDWSAGVLDDWTMNLLHKSCIDKKWDHLSQNGARHELVWHLPPKFFIARIQGMVRYTCFWDILKNVRQELDIPFVRRDRYTEKLATP